jgi:hypothetical protein
VRPEKRATNEIVILTLVYRPQKYNLQFYLTINTNTKDVYKIYPRILIIVEKIELVSSFIYSQPYANMESRLYNTLWGLYKTWWKYPPSFRWIFNHLLRMLPGQYVNVTDIRTFIIISAFYFYFLENILK